MIEFKIEQTTFQLVHLKKDVFRKNMAGHRHSSNSYELHYICDGSGILTTESEEYRLSKGDFFVTGPNVYHQQSTDPCHPMLEISLYLQVTSSKSVGALLQTFLETHFYISNQPQLLALFEHLITEQTQQAFGYQTAIVGLLQLLITELCRLYLPHTSENKPTKDTLNEKRFLIIEEAFIYHADQLTLSSLSKQVGLCERQLQRLLQKYYGMSFREKMREARSRPNFRKQKADP